MWIELIESLRPLLGELLSILITALILLIKRKFDINKINDRVSKKLDDYGVDAHVKDEVLAVVTEKLKKFKQNGQS
jgi:hypothetical protein